MNIYMSCDDTVTIDKILEHDKDNKENLDSLVKRIRSGKVVPYVGAGMSVLFKGIYPVWSIFLENTFNKYIDDTEKKEHFESLKENDKKAQFLYDILCKIDRDLFSENLVETFGLRHINGLGEDMLFDKAIYLLPLIFKNNIIITTNYDKVIEKAYALWGIILNVVSRNKVNINELDEPCLNNNNREINQAQRVEAIERSIKDRELLLYKIHGDILEPKTSCVMTEKDYSAAYKNFENDILQEIYDNSSLLFLGCSLKKEGPLQILNNIVESSKASNKNMHNKQKYNITNYAIVESKHAPSDKVNKKQKKSTEDFKEKLLTELNIKTILYPPGQHESVRVILEHIVMAVNQNSHLEYERKIDLHYADIKYKYGNMINKLKQSKSIKITQSKDKLLYAMAFSFQTKGQNEHSSGNYGLSSSYYCEAERLFLILKDKKRASKMLLLQGINIMLLSPDKKDGKKYKVDRDLASKYYKEAKVLYSLKDKKDDDLEPIDCEILVLQGSLLSRIGEYEKVELYYKRAKSGYHRYGNKLEIANIYRLLGLNRRKDRLNESNSGKKIKSIHKGLKYLQKAEEIYSEKKDQSGNLKIDQAKGHLFRDIGTVYEENGKNKKAKVYYKKAKESYSEGYNKIDRADVLRQRYYLMAELFRINYLLDNREETDNWRQIIEEERHFIPYKVLEYMERECFNTFLNDKIMKRETEQTRQELDEKTGFNKSKTLRVIKGLIEKNLVQKRSKGPGAKYIIS